MTRLHDLLVDLPEPDHQAADAVHERAAQILRPSGALAWLDELARGSPARTAPTARGSPSRSD